MTDYLSMTRMTRQERRDWYASIRHDADEVAALVRHVAKTAWHSDHVESVEDAEAFGGGYLASLIGVGWGALPEMLNVALIHAIDACRPPVQVASCPRVWLEPDTPPDCAGCGAPDGVPCVDDECSGRADPDAYEMF